MCVINGEICVVNGWNAWTVMSQKDIRHNPNRSQVSRQLPPVITGTYGRMILISGMIPKEKAGKSDLHS